MNAAEPHDADLGLANTAATLPARARAFAISDEMSYRTLVEFVRGCRALRDEIGATLDPHIKRAYDAHKALVAEKKTAEADALLAERIGKDEIVRWETAIEAQVAATRRADEQASRDAAAATVLERALAADADGDIGTAEAILDEPLHVPVAPVRPDVRPGGVSMRATWKARVVNLQALVVYAAAHPQYLQMLLANQAALDLAARSFRGQLKIPGVEAVCIRDAGIRK